MRGRLVAVLALVGAVAVTATAGGPGALAKAKKVKPGTSFTVWVQTVDSCKQALPAAAYQLTGGGATRTAQAPPGRKRTIVPTAACPLLHGNFTGLAAGTYTLTTTRTPPPDRSDPEGFAPCQGGSACRSQVATITVSASGAVQGAVTDVYPDGVSEIFPSASSFFAATPTDPVVFHDFGLAAPGYAPQCDGDSDADDHLTGNMRGHCGYPEADEAAACQPYPWSCSMPATRL